jgi:DNA-binding MarR family transcriptional regulator
MQRSGMHPSQRELADHTGLETLYVSKLARALQADGLIERTRDSYDTRTIRLALTDQGRKAIRPTSATVHGLLGELLAPLGGRDSARTERFVRDLSVLLDAPLNPPQRKET